MANNQDQIKELTERLEEGVKAVFESDKYGEYLRVMSKFYNYSYRNTLLIAMQRPDATMVAGFEAWKKKFGRLEKRERSRKAVLGKLYRERECQLYLKPILVMTERYMDNICFMRPGTD